MSPNAILRTKTNILTWQVENPRKQDQGNNTMEIQINLALIEKLVHAPLINTTAPSGFQPSRNELPEDIGQWPENWRAEFTEQADAFQVALLETASSRSDGDLSRQQAEEWAETIVRAAYRLRKTNKGE